MSDPYREMSESAKHVVDGLSFMTLLGALVNLLPSIAAVLTIIWTAIRIYETDTIRRLTGRSEEE